MATSARWTRRGKRPSRERSRPLCRRMSQSTLRSSVCRTPVSAGRSGTSWRLPAMSSASDRSGRCRRRKMRLSARQRSSHQARHRPSRPQRARRRSWPASGRGFPLARASRARHPLRLRWRQARRRPLRPAPPQPARGSLQRQAQRRQVRQPRPPPPSAERPEEARLSQPRPQASSLPPPDQRRRPNRQRHRRSWASRKTQAPPFSSS